MNSYGYRQHKGAQDESMRVSIEKAKLKHASSIFRIDQRQIGSFTRRRFIERAIRRGQCFLARTGDRIVGFAVVDQTFYEQSFIWLLIVDPDYRRLGVASKLVHNIEKVAPTRKLFTSTNRSNVAMQQLMNKLNFAKSGRIENLDKHDPEILYFKRIRKRC